LEPDDPATIGGHRLAGRLASGGLGVTYLARDDRGGRVAVKTTHARKAEQSQARRRLRTEAACARRLPSSCTAHLLVDGTDQQPPYLISEYVEGPSLEQIVDDRGPLEPEQVRALAVAVARVLAAIHGAGLIHCDLKPANVLLATDGPRVMGFDIAQEVPAPGEPAEIGAVARSPEWMAPERLTGGPASLASDVFGWGCLVSYAATGRSPFGEADADEPGGRTITQPPELNALDEPLRSLVEAALANNPADRPAAGDLVSRLGAVKHAATGEPPERSTGMHSRPGTAADAVTDPGPEPGAGPTPGRVRRPWWVKALIAASVPVALAAALAVVIATTGTDSHTGRHEPVDPGRAATPPRQEATGSDRPTVQGPRTSGPGLPRPAAVADAPNGPGSPAPGRPGRRIPYSGPGRPGAPSAPGASSRPRPPSAPPASSPAAPPPPSGTLTPSPTPTPTST
jgi:serine/threonine protein kinase